MILHQNRTFQARWEMGQLYVIDRSPDLPKIPEHILLLPYLFLLAQEHWCVKQMAFEGFVLTVEMERFEPQGQRAPRYLVQTLDQILASGEWSPYPFSRSPHLHKEQNALNESFAETIRAKGWAELATSKPLGDLLGGLTVISIWMKY